MKFESRHFDQMKVLKRKGFKAFFFCEPPFIPPPYPYRTPKAHFIPPLFMPAFPPLFVTKPSTSVAINKDSARTFDVSAEAFGGMERIARNQRNYLLH